MTDTYYWNDAEKLKADLYAVLCERNEMSTEITDLRAEIERLRGWHKAIVRKYERVMLDPPDWTNFTQEQLTWIREAWFGAAQISRAALEPKP